MSKLLINESPLTFQPSLACVIGLNEAIALQQIHYWLVNQKNKGYEQDGYKWVYNTYKEWQENNFPFWSENTVQRIFASLEEKGLVISIQPMKSKYDRTKYYRIDYTKLEAFDDPKSTPIDDPKLGCSLNESENTTEKTTEKENPDILDGILEFERTAQAVKTAQQTFEDALGVNGWPWDSTPAWRRFAKWVTTEYQNDQNSFRKYAEWRKGDGKFQAMSNNKIRQMPDAFIDTAWPTFLAHVSMYQTKKDRAL